MLREADPFQAHRVSPSQTISPCEQTLDYLAYVPNDLNLVIFRPFAGSQVPPRPIVLDRVGSGLFGGGGWSGKLVSNLKRCGKVFGYEVQRERGRNPTKFIVHQTLPSVRTKRQREKVNDIYETFVLRAKNKPKTNYR